LSSLGKNEFFAILYLKRPADSLRGVSVFPIARRSSTRGDKALFLVLQAGQQSREAMIAPAGWTPIQVNDLDTFRR